MSHPVKIMAVLTAKPGKEEELKSLLLGMAAASRAEEGNLRYDLWLDQANPAKFIIDELYTAQAAVDSHRDTPHFKAYLGKVGDLADRSALVLDPVDVAWS